MLTESDKFVLPESIKDLLQTFFDAIAKDRPDKVIFKEMGMGNMEVERVFEQIKASFNLN